MSGLASQCVDALQELWEAKTQVTTLEAIGTEHLAKIGRLNSHEREHLGGNRLPGHQLVTVRVEKKRHETGHLEIGKAVTDAKFELENAKRPSICSKAMHLQIGPQCVAPSRAMTASRPSWRQRHQRSKLHNGLLLRRFTTLSDAPVTCGQPTLRCRNVRIPTCRMTFRWKSTNSSKSQRRIS